jgi:hypothetical protein
MSKKDDGILYVDDDSGDNFLDVTFYTKIENDQEVEFVNIKVPGDKTLEIDTQVQDSHKRRFAQKYNAFKSMESLTGTPIEEWSDITDGFKRELAYLGFKYVEQLAGAPDSAFGRVVGGTQWRVKAQAFLNRGKVSAEDVIKKQQAQIDELRKQMEEVMGNPVVTEQVAKRGRPAKTQVEEE